MRFRLVTIASAAMGLLATAAHADGTDGQDSQVKATTTLARHHTTNALDGPLALADWYTALRGALEGTVAHELGSTRVTAEFQSRRYDVYDIEDDTAGSLAVETTVRPSDVLELRGTLSLKLTDEGDDLDVDDYVVGTRTRKTTLAAALQAGVKLAPDTVLVLEGAASRERAGDTAFEEDVFEPTRLEPDRDRLRFGASLMRTQGIFGYGVAGSAGYLHASETALLREIALADYMAKFQARATFAGGASVGAAAGVHLLHAPDLPFTEARPIYELTADAPLPHGFSLRAALRGGYELVATDDPLASFVQRLEAEAGYRLVPTVRLGVGVFAERRDNLGYENWENVRGLYGEVAWEASERVVLLFRVDSTRRATPALDIGWRTLETQLALTMKL